MFTHQSCKGTAVFMATLLPRVTGQEATMVNRSNVGISNREGPAEEARDRELYPPAVGDAAEPERDEPETLDIQTSTKTGTKASAQKEQSTRHAERTAPSAAKVSGAFGKE